MFVRKYSMVVGNGFCVCMVKMIVVLNVLLCRVLISVCVWLVLVVLVCLVYGIL